MALTRRKLEIFIDVMDGTVGWMYKVGDFWGGAAEKYAEKYIDARNKRLWKEKNGYYIRELPKVRKKIKEFKEENKEFARDCQIRRKRELEESLREKYRILEQKLEHYGDIREKKKLFWEIEMLERKINSRINDEMVERARNYPIADLIKSKKNWAICPFHDDKHPSLYLKNNFYYCFSCGASGSTIDLCMRLDNIDFVSAVIKLQNY